MPGRGFYSTQRGDSDPERQALSAHVEEGYLQAERGEMKETWRQEHASKR
ncbi:MAG: hypothetical protein HYR60_27550 [Acidobacteria bacterium]|nr:hypothetical protein [Acidobacteriota bacterium]